MIAQFDHGCDAAVESLEDTNYSTDSERSSGHGTSESVSETTLRGVTMDGSGYDTVMYKSDKDMSTRSGQGKEEEEKVAPVMAPKLWFSGLSGYAFCFEEELRALVLSLPSSSKFLGDEKQLIFNSVVDIFVETARPFAQRVIDESFLDEPQRTIKPDIQFGGLAGGKKYRHGNQLFKLAQDVELRPGVWIYGGNQRSHRMAMKSAGHEIKATQAIVDACIPELNAPMMAVFTYRQRRVICTSLVPISGVQTLVQGKANALDDSLQVPPPDVADVMSSLGASLNIARSPCGIYGPFDMEVHSGTDGRLYVIDAARLCPPEYRGPQSVGPNLFYQLLRPELLRLMKEPLLPDAFQLRDREALDNLINASQVLDAQIRQLARELDQGLHGEFLSSRSQVKSLLHSQGINMRHLGTLAGLLHDYGAMCCLTDAVRRCTPSDQMDVKVLRLPRERGKEELMRVLKLQHASLKGARRLMIVPTLLDLGTKIWTQIPLTIEENFEMGEFPIHRPSGSHPFVQAFEICEKFDPLFARTSSRVTDCSPITARVILMLRHLCSTFPFFEGKFLYPSVAKVLVEKKQFQTDMSFVFSVQKFLTADAYKPGDDLKTAMMVASKHGRWDVVLSLAKQYERENGDEFALQVAAKIGKLDYLRGRVIPDHMIPSLLLSAGQGGQDEVCNFLFKLMGDTPPEDASTLGRAMVNAASNNHLSTVRLLLDHRADISFHDDLFQNLIIHRHWNQGTALVVAAAQGYLDLVHLLLARADSDKLRVFYGEALSNAALRGHEGVVRLLVESGADVDARIYKTAMNSMCLAAWRGNTRIIRALLELDADINFKTKNEGWTPLLYATVEGQLGAVELLVELKADVNYQLPNETSSSALARALSKGDSKIAQVLRDGGAK